MLKKPMTTEELFNKIREILDEVMPKKSTDDNAESNMLDTVVGIDGFLLKKESSGDE